MPNKNILIEPESHDTISNAKTIVEFLREFHYEQQFSKTEPSINSNIATAMMLECVVDALSYEHGRVEMMGQKRKLKK